MSSHKETAVKVDRNTSDQTLLEQWNCGNKIAFLLLYERYYQLGIAYGKTFTKSWYLAEDLIQDVFIRFYEKGIQTEGNIINDFRKYYQIAIYHKWIDYRRKQKRRDELEQPAIQLSSFDPTAEFESNDFFQKFVFAMLPESQREVWEHKMKGYNNKEVAELLHKSETQIRGLSYRAKQKLLNFRAAILQELLGI